MKARLERAIVRFRVQSAQNLLDEAFGAAPQDVVARELVLPLYEQFEHSGDPALIRFAASLFEVRLLAQARAWDRIDGPLVMLACAPREERTLGLITLGLALAAKRCRVGYLGAATPALTLRATVEEQDAALTVISAERDDLSDGERGEFRPLELLLIGGAAEPLAASLGGAVTALDGQAAADLAHRRSSRWGDAASPSRP